MHSLVQDALGITQVPQEIITLIKSWLDPVQILDYQSIAFALADLRLHEYLYQTPSIMYALSGNIPLLSDDDIIVLDDIVLKEPSVKQARKKIDEYIKSHAINKSDVNYWGSWGHYL